MKLGELVSNYRKEHKISMDVFSDMSGLSKSYISILEKNEHPTTGKPVSPSVDAYKKIASAIGMSFNDLLAIVEDNISLEDDLVEKNTYGDHKKNLEYFQDKPEILETYKEIYENETLQLLFDSARDLEPEDLEAVIKHINLIKAARRNE